MENWTFDELSQTINEVFNDYLQKKYCFLDAGSYTIEDFWEYEEEDSRLENLIIVVRILLLILKETNRVFNGTILLYERLKKNIENETILQQLPLEDFKKFSHEKSKLEILLKNAKIEYDPNAK